MSTQFGALRRRILTPSVKATKLETRGFYRKNRKSQERLESIGETFLRGYGHAVEARTPAEAERLLETVPREVRGFAYEGAGMGATVMDALPGRGGRLASLLDGEGRHHVYMVYVGVGWAMARLPRFLWPDVTRLDPLLRPLILDGYGFHQAYFRTRRWVHSPGVAHGFHWAGGSSEAAAKVIDQGIGRAMWFVGGTDADRVADLIAAFPAHRHGDLYAGTGLAATYAGGVAETELRRLVERAGEHRYRLAQGSAFAAEARRRAGTLAEHNGLATQVICGMPPEEASEVCVRTRPAVTGENGATAYEDWRDAISAGIAAHLQDAKPGQEEKAAQARKGAES